jgi:type VI protein secretion system component Hcp
MKKLLLFSILFSIVFLGSMFFSNSYGAQADYFLKIDGIKGESTTKGTEEWIKLESIQYGESDLDLLIRSAAETKKESRQSDSELTLLKQVDKSSPLLFNALVMGQNLGTGQINICENETCAVKLLLSDLYIVDYQITSSEDNPKESFRIAFSDANLAQDTDSSSDTNEIPGWIKNNAKWFADGSIGESDFTKGIEYMIKEKIMKIENLPDTSSTSETKVPEWIKNNAKWWSEGQIDDSTFVQGIAYLVEHGIIRVN